eukprot:TRINITY_DN3163_c0_g1_i1.p2 TRINITY_DN3163_c0_g1~~TRINITY_DN3163_c0_g1_i1.p2  ORF type:complete len:155 (+),score=3.47 TRINITY_DN3163_c0_g1_i1:433-897(+)
MQTGGHGQGHNRGVRESCAQSVGSRLVRATAESDKDVGSRLQHVATINSCVGSSVSGLDPQLLQLLPDCCHLALAFYVSRSCDQGATPANHGSVFDETAIRGLIVCGYLFNTRNKSFELLDISGMLLLGLCNVDCLWLFMERQRLCKSVRNPSN